MCSGLTTKVGKAELLHVGRLISANEMLRKTRRGEKRSGGAGNSDCTAIRLRNGLRLQAKTPKAERLPPKACVNTTHAFGGRLRLTEFSLTSENRCAGGLRAILIPRSTAYAFPPYIFVTITASACLPPVPQRSPRTPRSARPTGASGAFCQPRPGTSSASRCTRPS